MALPADYIREDATAAPLGEGTFAIVKKGIVYDSTTGEWWVPFLHPLKFAQHPSLDNEHTLPRSIPSGFLLH